MKKNKDVLVVVDMQNDFIDGSLGTKEAQSIVEIIIDRIHQSLSDSDVIFVTQDTHLKDVDDEVDYLNTEEGKNLPVEHCIWSTHGWEINESIYKVLIEAEMTHKFVHFLNKDTFGSRTLAMWLRTLECDYNFNIQNITIVGLCTDICVIANAIIAKTFLPNAHIIVDASCCAGITPESHDLALDAMRKLQVEIINQGKEPWRT